MVCPVIPKNENNFDRILRVMLGIAAVFVGHAVSGAAQVGAYVVGAVLMLTGITGFCGIYALLGISTRSKHD